MCVFLGLIFKVSGVIPSASVLYPQPMWGMNTCCDVWPQEMIKTFTTECNIQCDCSKIISIVVLHPLKIRC